MSRGPNLDSWGHTFARLLAESLADEEWWEAAATFPSDADWQTETAARAVELYRVTSRFVRERLDADEITPVDHAAGVLRGVADTCAMLSQTWTAEVRDELHVPTRPLTELVVRLYDLDEWAQALGCPLTLADDKGVPDEAWPEGEVFADMTQDYLVEQFAARAATYANMLDLRADPGDANELREHQDLREGACLEISWSRACMIWIRSHLPTELESIGIAMLFIAQAFFVMSREANSDEPLFPSKDYLRSLLERTDAHVWLYEQGAELPAWLEP